MRKFLLVLLLSCMLLRAEDGKVREIHPDTGRPIYEEGEVIPSGVQAHIRRKDGTFLSAGGTVVVQIIRSSQPEQKLEKIKPTESQPEVKVAPKAEKAREIQPDTGCPIYEEGEVIPPGVSAHIRRKDGTFLTDAKTIVVEIKNNPVPFTSSLKRKHFT